MYREMRSRIASCFAIQRSAGPDGTVISVPAAPLSRLVPPGGGPRQFPRLLICATANITVQVPGRPSAGFVPFVMSHDVCGVSGGVPAAFPTQNVENVIERTGLHSHEPIMSLMTAVSVTGGAVSPNMGRFTVPSVGLAMAAINLRLGRSLPNPFSPRAQRRVGQRTTPGRLDWVQRMGPAYDELIPDMVAFQGPQAYISDGGHYDNLGLMELLRARCAEIWCVDAAAEKSGNAAEIRRVLLLAKAELNVDSNVDVDRLAAGADGVYGSTRVAGTLEYPGGYVARIVIIKLGFGPDTPEDVRAHKEMDGGFPHHRTIHQVYGRDRMDAYRKLGYDSATRASRAAPQAEPARS